MVFLPSIYASLRISNYSKDPIGITNIVLTIIISKIDFVYLKRQGGLFLGFLLDFLKKNTLSMRYLRVERVLLKVDSSIKFEIAKKLSRILFNIHLDWNFR